MRSSAATKCISLVPGLAKHVSIPARIKVWIKLSAPFIVPVLLFLVLLLLVLLFVPLGGIFTAPPPSGKDPP